MEGWRRSQGEVKKSRSSRFGDDVTTTFFSPSGPKLFVAAMRLATAQAELGAYGGLLCPPEEEHVGWAVPTSEQEDCVFFAGGRRGGGHSPPYKPPG